MTQHDLIQDLLNNTLRQEVSPSAQKGMKQVLYQFKEGVSFHERTRKHTRPHPLALLPERPHAWLRPVGMVAVACVCLAVGILVFANGTPTWAQVVERFASVKHVSAVVYVREDGLANPVQYELWMGHQSRVRVRTGKQILFGRAGEVLNAYDLETRMSVDPDPVAWMFFRQLTTTETFSLETVLNSMCRGKLVDMTPTFNPDAVLSEDMLVFDVVGEDSREWVRIWILKESRLPVHIRVWDPTDAMCVDVFLQYAQEQPRIFFDPDAFEKRLSQSPDAIEHLIYADLVDPGGRLVSSLQYRNQRRQQRQKEGAAGYHMPTLDAISRAPDGLVKVKTSNARNTQPDGHRFFGYERIEDDLGQQYVRVVNNHTYDEDWASQVFAPEDYPFAIREPNRLILICEAPVPIPGSHKGIGTHEVTEWTSTPVVKGESVVKKPRYQGTLARHFLYQKDWSRFDRIQATIKGAPAQNLQACYRDIRNVERCVRMKDYVTGARLAEALLPDMVGRALTIRGRSMSPELDLYQFERVLGVLARAGNIELVKKTFDTLINTPLTLSPKLHPHSKQAILKQRKDMIERCTRHIAEALVNTGRLDLDQLTHIMGAKVVSRKDFSNICNTAHNNPARLKNENRLAARLKELTEYYDTHPLPASMELCRRSSETTFYLPSLESGALPGHNGYAIQPISGTLEDVVKTLRYSERIHPRNFIKLRIDSDKARQPLFADLVYKEGSSFKQRMGFMLAHQGLELIVEEDQEPRPVWALEYNGQPLRPYGAIAVPRIMEWDGETHAPHSAGGQSAGMALNALLFHLAQTQNQGKAEQDQMVFVDETGLTAKLSLSYAFWQGPRGFAAARTWFKDNFGITFKEGQRPMKTMVVRDRK